MTYLLTLGRPNSSQVVFPLVLFMWDWILQPRHLQLTQMNSGIGVLFWIAFSETEARAVTTWLSAAATVAAAAAKPGIIEKILVVLAEIIFLVLLTFFSALVA